MFGIHIHLYVHSSIAHVNTASNTSLLICKKGEEPGILSLLFAINTSYTIDGNKYHQIFIGSAPCQVPW